MSALSVFSSSFNGISFTKLQMEATFLSLESRVTRVGLDPGIQHSIFLVIIIHLSYQNVQSKLFT